MTDELDMILTGTHPSVNHANSVSMAAELARIRAENERLRRALYAAGWWMDLPCSDACPSDDLHGLEYDEQREWVEHTIIAALKGE